MIYLFIALKAEAQAFIQTFKLIRDPKQKNLYVSNQLTLLITGVGIDNSVDTIRNFLIHKKITTKDLFYNIGLCAAPAEIAIGSLLDIAKVHYKNSDIVLKKEGSVLFTFDEACEKTLPYCADMEAFGAVHAAQEYFDRQQIHVLKIVSDHFEPETLTKNLAQTLISRQIKQIQNHFQKEASWPQSS